MGDGTASDPMPPRRRRRLSDALDAKILLALVADPRSTIAGLAHRLSVARNTVHARMNRLEEEALHPSDHRIDPAALGYPLRAYVLANLKQRRLDEVGRRCRRSPKSSRSSASQAPATPSSRSSPAMPMTSTGSRGGSSRSAG